MNKLTNLKSSTNLDKESKISGSSTSALYKASCFTSNQPSTSNSLSNISISFLKDSNFPRLFSHSPTTPIHFSFNNHPTTTKNSSMRSSFNSGFLSESRSPSMMSRKSQVSFGGQNHERKQSLFFQKPNDIQSSESTICLTKELKQKIIKPQQLSLNHLDPGQKTQNIKVFIRIKPSINTDILVRPYIERLDDQTLDICGKIVDYDHVFCHDAGQVEIFEKVAQPILQGILQGYNGTIFAYGQTGSGKTHTIFGGDNEDTMGIIPRSVGYIFNKTSKQHKISMSLLEIYKEDLIDLTNDCKMELKIKETSSGTWVQNLTMLQITNSEETIPLIESCLKNRRVATTKMNQKSSRSHTILTFYVQSMDSLTKLCLIDLAGSEKASKAGVVGQNFEEMKKINSSLSCLGNVINALATRKKTDHIPYRNSKLTRLLKDSLSNRFRTSIIVNCASDFGTQDQTTSSLKFADRAKKVKITIGRCSAKGKQNVEYLQRVIQQLTSDLYDTKRQLDKFKQICTQIQVNQKQLEAPRRSQQSPEVTARQTIPSERAHLDQQMKRYGKQNKRINVISLCRNTNERPKQRASDDITSLNISRSTINLFGQMNSPSISSLSYRPDEGTDDLSFHLSVGTRDEHPFMKS